MNHEQILNLMLANICPMGDNKTDDVRAFGIDLHCTYIYIVARLLNNEEPYRYEILYYDLQNWDNVEARRRALDFAESL